jgi:hypothetical protein
MFSEDPTMPTYKTIEHEVRRAPGFVPKTCWIADALEFGGKKLSAAPNRTDPKVRKHPCPFEKRAAIIEALRKLERQNSVQYGSYL